MAKLDQIKVSGTTYEIVPEIAPLFSTSTAYAVGDCVIKDAVLYRFTSAHAAGAWTGNDVETITVGGELTDLKQDLSEKGLSDEVKNALLTMFRHVVFLDAEAEDAYSVLESLLLPSIITIGPQTVIVIQNAKSGDPITFLLYVSPIQNFNGYDKPWGEGKGNNIVPYFNSESKSGITTAVDSQGVITISGTASATFLSGSRITLNKDKVYYVNGSPSTSNAAFTIRDLTGGVINDNGIVFGTGDFNGESGRIACAQDNYGAQLLIRAGSGSSPSGKWYPMIIPEGENNHLKSKFLSGTKGNLTFTVGSDGAITVSGTNSETVNYGVSLTLPAGDYVIGGNRSLLIVLFDAENGTKLSQAGVDVFSGNDTASHRGATFTLTDTLTMWVAIQALTGTYSNKKCYPVLCDKVIKSTEYSPYSNICPFTRINQAEMNHGASLSSYSTENLSIPQGELCYGGIVDFVNQTFKAYKYYSSYNGQALSGKWISSMEEYEDGTMPTSGAEVIDLETLDSLSVSVNKIPLLSKANALWSDDGDVLLTYEREV